VRLPLQCDELVKEGAKTAATPADVVRRCDVTFAVLADPAAALEVSSSSTPYILGGLLVIDLSVHSNRLASCFACALL